MSNKCKWFFSIIVSVICTIVLFIQSKNNIGNLNNCILWILGTIYLIIIWRFLFCEYFITRFNEMAKTWKKVVVILFSIAICIFGVLVLPFGLTRISVDNYISKEIDDSSLLRVETVGEHNEKSEGYNVWIEGIKLNGKDVNLYEVELEDGWEFNEDRPFSCAIFPTGVNVNIEGAEAIKLDMRSGEDYGICTVKIGHLSKKIDLYSEEYQQHNSMDVYSLFRDSVEIELSTYEYVLYYAAYIITLGMFSMVVSMFIINFVLRERKLKRVEK